MKKHNLKNGTKQSPTKKSTRTLKQKSVKKKEGGLRMPVFSNIFNKNKNKKPKSNQSPIQTPIQTPIQRLAPMEVKNNLTNHAFQISKPTLEVNSTTTNNKVFLNRSDIQKPGKRPGWTTTGKTSNALLIDGGKIHDKKPSRPNSTKKILKRGRKCKT